MSETEVKREYLGVLGRPRPAALLGAVLIGVTLPVALVSISRYGRLTGFDEEVPLLSEWAASALFLQIAAFIGCGPGALIIGYFLFAWIAVRPDGQPLIMESAAFGAISAFFNFPGYLCTAYIHNEDGLHDVRIVALFVVTGATCGAWIGYQGWRWQQNQDAPPFPRRFSLQTLMFLAIGWGLLFWLFQPGSTQ